MKEVVPMVDTNNIEANIKIVFSFQQQNVDLGGVVVHLHHSTRTIQIQGSRVINSQKAALWFTNYVVARIREQAKIKQYQIRNFNEVLIRSSLSSSSNLQGNFNNTCHHCENIFNIQSKPTFCDLCLKYCHRTCIKDHKKTCKLKTVNSSVRNPSSSVSSQIPLSLLRPIPNEVTMTSSIDPALVISRVHTPTLSTSTITSSLTSSAVNSLSSSLSNYSTTRGSITSSLVSTSQAPPTRQKNDPPRRQAQKKAQDPDDNLTIEFLQRELNATRARITQLDTEIEDKNKRISILKARVDFLEERENKNIYDKYFPSSNSNSTQNGEARDRHTHQVPLSQQACSTTPQQFLCNHCAMKKNDNSELLKTILENILEKLSLISADMNIVRKCAETSNIPFIPSDNISSTIQQNDSDTYEEPNLIEIDDPMNIETAADTSSCSIETLIPDLPLPVSPMKALN